ncbi:MAG: aldo/keto reductase, partial [Clostridium perfringens]|nr:aldo/keto reductase [Clostridium perfringens]
GYRHIDAAAVYKNEKSVGQGIKESNIPREELFITSKVWNTERGYESTLKAFEKTIADLQLDYLDLYLIHWPASSSKYKNWEEINMETWRAMTDLYKAGKIRSIGVSNFLPHHLEALVKTEIAPMVNQIEFHPGQMQKEVVDYCRKHKIQIEAWSPLGTGLMLKNEKLKKIAEKYNKSVAQLCIRWCIQNGAIPLPKSVTPSRIKENTEIFDFVISNEDMDTINNMPYLGGSGLNPDKINF